MAHKVGQIAEKTSKLSDITTLIVFLCLAFVFATFHKFNTVVKLDSMTADEIAIEKVEITEQVKKTVRPAIVRIPIAVEDEEELEEDVELEIETADFDIRSDPPPPPPPPTLTEDEIFDFYAIQEKPELMSGYAEKIQEYIKKNYPPLARKSGVSGKVIVKFVCSKEGIPTNVAITLEKPTDMGFGDVAIKAMEQARFKPGMQRDKPVPVRMSQKIDFKTNVR
ncbi:MAG: energy transducer TonB [Candidatus Delongbacteria bacterium]|nr:energy transducer TonB [Candidatus Delongbacteria bacterium]MCG2760083.1 energy transducer TonB [Candidatus Delongbacteria bacterium]